MEGKTPTGAKTVLADHNIEGQALLIWGTLGAEGWLEVMPIRLVRFIEVGLSITATGRSVWRFAQEHQMILLTDNRNMDDPDSLEQTIRDENTPHALPVLTIANTGRVTERTYREECAARLVEVVIDIDKFRGVGRLFIP